MNSKIPRVLIIHDLEATTRNTTIEYTCSFARHAKGVEVDYVNIFGFVASDDLAEEYDLAIVTCEALSVRSSACWPDVEKRILELFSRAKRKILLPQDDYTYSSRLDSLAVKAKVDRVLTPLSDGLELLYPLATKANIDFKLVLTGYLEAERIKTYNEFSYALEGRQVDLGQRVSKLPVQFGVGGRRKADIAERMAQAFADRGYTVDVSTSDKDSFVGEAWLNFLGNTRFTVSRKGGSSLGDTQNRMAETSSLIRLLAPWMPDKLVAKFSSKQGVVEGSFEAVSPRLFEAAALGVCQILEEDDYLDGAMVPWKHYIPLKSDFSNISEIFNFIENTSKVNQMIEDARYLLVESNLFTYEKFVRDTIENELGTLGIGKGIKQRVRDLDGQDNDSSNPDPSLRETKIYFTKTSIPQIIKDRFTGHSKILNSLVSNSKRFLPETYTRPWLGLSAFGKYFK